MIKIVASTKVCGDKRTKQFSTNKNRHITLEEISKLENWIVNATQMDYLVEINYKITFDTDMDRRFNHTIASVGCKTYVKTPERVRNTLERAINDINRQVK